MRHTIAVVGFLLSTFNDVVVPAIVSQQPSPIQARLKSLVWLQDGTMIKWCPSNDSVRGYSAWKIFCNQAINQRCCTEVVIPMLRRESAGIEWVDGDFKPALPPSWYGRH